MFCLCHCGNKSSEVQLKGNIFPDFKVAKFVRGFLYTDGPGVGVGTGHCSNGESLFPTDVHFCDAVERGKFTGAR